MAVVVKVTSGAPEKSRDNRQRSAYSGRKAGPHSEMRCASSMANSFTGKRPKAVGMRSVISRYGVILTRLARLSDTRFQAATFSSLSLSEWMLYAATPASLSAAT